MVDEKVATLGGAMAITIGGLGIIAHKLQWQIHPPDVVVRTAEVIAQVVKYTVYGIVGLAVLAGLFFGVRHALRTWTGRRWISTAGWLVGIGLFFWGMSNQTIPLIAVGIISVWVGVLAVPAED